MQESRRYPPRAVQEFLCEHEALRVHSVAAVLFASVTNGGAAAPICL